jgi:hypothetical protein
MQIGPGVHAAVLLGALVFLPTAQRMWIPSGRNRRPGKVHSINRISGGDRVGRARPSPQDALPDHGNEEDCLASY